MADGYDVVVDAAGEQVVTREDGVTAVVVLGLLVLLALFRYVAPEWRFLPSRPPMLWLVLAVVAGGLFVWALVGRWLVPLTLGFVTILVLFVVLKTELLATAVSAGWRGLTGQDVTLAAVIDLNWLGFSYVAFRLLHTVRDRQTGLLPAIGLCQYVTYVLFAPAYIAGPIDRAERFGRDWQALPMMVGLDGGRFVAAGQRLAVGLGQKFVVADSLALGLSLNPVNVHQVTTGGGLWFLLYGYAFRLFLIFVVILIL